MLRSVHILVHKKKGGRKVVKALWGAALWLLIKG